MKIGLITTLKTNIGDDFIREGICFVLREVFKGQSIEFVSVNKHLPLTVYPGWHPAHLSTAAGRLPMIGVPLSSAIESFASRLGHSAFDSCDLIVQCGAPVLWPNCHMNEWAEPLWHHVVGRLYKQIPVLNIAAGSCYPWERQPDSITDRGDEEYLKRILGYCRLTTTRDELAYKLCSTLGKQAPFIPCSALLAAGGILGAERDGTVLINYMPGGGHFDWGQGIDAKAWESTMKQLIGRLMGRHKVAFLCHNEAEYGHAEQLEPSLPRFFPKTVAEYFQVASAAKGAICNRMHASVSMASMGIPSVAICTDTRLLMVKTIGLPVFYIKDADLDKLEASFEKLLTNRISEKERLLALRTQTWNRYVEAISDAI